jgi:hypothetical protein
MALHNAHLTKLSIYSPQFWPICQKSSHKSSQQDLTYIRTRQTDGETKF